MSQSREARLATLLAGTDAETLIPELATRPVAEVDVLLRALRAAKNAGRDHEREVRAQRRRDHKRYGRTDDDKIVAAANAMTKSLAKRAGYTLETLAALGELVHHGQDLLADAVADARAQGYSDPDIGRALRVTPQAIGARYGRRSAQPDAAGR